MRDTTIEAPHGQPGSWAAAREGLVRVRRGRGAFVRDFPVITRNATHRFADCDRGRGGFDVEMREVGLEPRHEVHVDRIAATDRAAGLLDVEPGVELVVRRRKFFAVMLQCSSRTRTSQQSWQKAGATGRPQSGAQTRQRCGGIR